MSWTRDLEREWKQEWEEKMFLAALRDAFPLLIRWSDLSRYRGGINVRGTIERLIRQGRIIVILDAEGEPHYRAVYWVDPPPKDVPRRR